MNTLGEFLPNFMHFDAVQSTNLILMLGTIMFLGAIGGRLFQKLKIPQVVGYIVIGILIGQSGLQVLRSDVITSLTPLSNIALTLIGFMIGGELKITVIKKYGKQFMGILLLEAIIPFIVVTILVTTISIAVTKNVPVSISIGAILGAISSATAPAATTDVLRENRTRGPLTTIVYGIVALDDAVALILYAVAASVASALLGSRAGSFAYQIMMLGYDVFASIIVGSIFGFLLSMFIRNVMKDEGRILAFSLGALFLSTGLCEFFQLDNILAAMSLGFFMVNFAPSKTRPVFSLTEKFTPPLYVLFFVLVGAKLNVWNVTAYIGFIALLYIICRTLGKSIGARLGAKITKAPETVYKYLPFCLLSQAGVAIGLSIAAGQDFADTIGPTILLIITATTFVVQLVGPVFVKYGVTKAGECGLDITEEDIMKNCYVSQVESSGRKICSKDSHTVVEETVKLGSLLESFSRHHNQNFVVKDQEGKFAGLITLQNLQNSIQMLEFSNAVIAADIMEDYDISCTPEMSIPEVYKLFEINDTDALPIIDKNGDVLGVIEKPAVQHYLRAQALALQQKLASLE
ncbi:MAG: cation:proton antiporter [Spirochaetia bacterium]|nr:cation:proton antiporter [Spirochaetia bacterium]